MAFQDKYSWNDILKWPHLISQYLVQQCCTTYFGPDNNVYLDQTLTYTVWAIFGKLFCFVLPEIPNFIVVSANTSWHPPQFWNTICEHNCTNWKIDFRDLCCMFFWVRGFGALCLDREDKPTRIPPPKKNKMKNKKLDPAQERVYSVSFDKKDHQITFQLQEKKPPKQNWKTCCKPTLHQQITRIAGKTVFFFHNLKVKQQTLYN